MTDNENANHTAGEWTWNMGYEDRMMKLLETGFDSDWTLIVGPQKEEIKVHKLLLGAASPKFYANFQKPDLTGCKDSAEQEEVLKNWEASKTFILNESPTIFHLFLKYVYTGKSGAKIQDGLQLIKLATDYEVNELIDQCATLLKGKLTDENVIPLFQQAMECAHKELIESSLKFICRNARRIVHLEEFKNLRLDCLVEIVKQDELRVRNELEIFNAVVKWAEAECIRQNLDSSNKDIFRKVMEKVLGYIRFPNMDQAEFALNVASKNILGMEELVSLLLCFAVPAENRCNIPSGRFISTTREYFDPSEGPKFFVSRSERPLEDRFQNFCKPSTASIMRETLRVKVDKKILLSGLKCLLKMYSNNGYEYEYDFDSTRANVNIKDVSDRVHQILVDEKNKIIAGSTDILLDRPLQLKPQGVYQLEVSFHGQIHSGSAFSVHQLAQNSTFFLYVGEKYKGEQDIRCKNEDDDEGTVHFEFTRAESDLTLPISQGFIEEFIFQVVN